jgi:hypothetical protein
MKVLKITYWICTILIVALMLFSAISTFNPNAQSVAMLKHLQLPLYLLQFLAIAKIGGAAALLVPGYPRLKEWAYAGYFFDLLGATWCFIAIGDPVAAWIPMFVFIAILAGSYFSYHQLQNIPKT